MFDLIWGAYFAGNPEPLWQYNSDGTEVPFKLVLDNQDNLVQFRLVNRRSLVQYKVDLQNGTIGITRHEIPYEEACFLEPRADMLRKDGLKYRLIYFREITRDFDLHLQEVGIPGINYFLGFQYKDLEGHNQKRLMCITADGRTVIN
jgi:hypothetical protein